MGGLALLQDEDQFVLGAVEAAHARRALVPDAEVELAEACCTGRGQHIAGVAPVHADIGDAAVDQGAVYLAVNLFQKAGELGVRHLAGTLDELAMGL